MLVDPNLIVNPDGKLRESVLRRTEKKAPRKVLRRLAAQSPEDQPKGSNKGRFFAKYA